MNAIEVLPGVAVFQGAIMKEFASSALQSKDMEQMRSHVLQLVQQLDEFQRLARRAVAAQNGEPILGDE